jgi:two-component system, NtrC family, response regulator HydG
MAHVLIVETDAAARSRLRGILESNGFAVAEPGAACLQIRALESVDVSGYACILSGSQLGIDGLEALRIWPGAPIILVARQPDVRQAVAAMKRGAYEYLAEPLLHDELIAAVERCVTEHRRRSGTASLGTSFPMIGDSVAMRDLYGRISKIGPTDSTVLIRGESGTGKELVARALHAASARAKAPMITLNCAAIPSHLIETELFGYSPIDADPHQARSGLLEAAEGGTLFLDEIGELGLEVQARLLRVLQAGESRRFGSAETFSVDVRLITATHRDLNKLISTGRFREDLFYRLNVVSLEVPPLRERQNDVLQLADFILGRTCAKLGKTGMGFHAEARQAIASYAWPGNIRELANAIERAVILCDGVVIGPELLAIDVRDTRSTDLAPGAADRTSLEDYFVSFVLGHQDSLTETELAEKLGISRKSLWERRQRLAIPRKRTRQRGPRRDQP